jgi:hypothetical protein
MVTAMGPSIGETDKKAFLVSEGADGFSAEGFKIALNKASKSNRTFLWISLGEMTFIDGELPFGGFAICGFEAFAYFPLLAG